MLLILSPMGISVFIPAKRCEPRQRVGEQRPSGGQGWWPPPSRCSSLQHSSIPRAQFPVLLPTLMHRPREGLTQPLALHGMIWKLKRHSMSESAVQGSAPSSPPQHKSARAPALPSQVTAPLVSLAVRKERSLSASVTWKAHSAGLFSSCSEHSPVECTPICI